MLAVLPNSPGLIHPGKNRDLLRDKRNRLLQRLHEKGKIDAQQLELALEEPLPDKPLDLPQIAPHLLTRFINSGQMGQRMRTTIQYAIQQESQLILNRHVANLKRAQIHNAAVIVMETETGKVLAYIGNSTDSTKNNAVDIIPAPRSSGSILKPFLFCHSLEEGIISPEMLLFDVPTYMNGYTPRNYYDHYDGLVPAQEALARSLNVPFVRLLADYGQRKFLEKLKMDGFTQFVFNADHYGTSLILGGGEVSLEDLANVYGRLAKAALQTDNGTDFHVVQGENYPSPSVFESAAAYHTLYALTKVVRPDIYGNWEQFEQPLRMAWKTGTSFGFRDAWAVGVTPHYTVAVWVGNADGEGRPGIIGVKAAAPLLFEIAKSLPTPNSSLPDFFEQPYALEEIVQICASSGMKAIDICPTKRERSLPQSVQKLGLCAYHQTIFLDKTKSELYRGHLNCRTQEELEEQVWFVLPPLAEKYYRSRHPNFRPLPSFSADCENIAQEQVMEIIYPKPESKISIPRGGDELRQQLVLEATHQLDGALIHWHLNDHYLGATTSIHQMKCSPEPGENTLLIVDGSGNRLRVTFAVEK
jgi:penicillin-binding protein 1C